MAKKLLQGQELKQRAIELGVSTHELSDSRGIESEPELQRRVLEAERSVRENKLWLIAVISAIASLFSAIAAWLAVWSS